MDCLKELYDKNRLRRDQLINQKIVNLESLETKIDSLLQQNSSQRKEADKKLRKMIENRFESIKQEINNEHE